MPQYKQSFEVPGYTSEALLHIAYTTFQKLEWNIKYAGPVSLLGHTKRSWKSAGEEITVEAHDGKLEITSKMVHGQAFDFSKRNRKNTEKFFRAFEAARSVYVPGQEGTTAEAIERLRTETQQAAYQEMKDHEEMERVMNLSSGSKAFTFGLMAVNIIVFIAMVFNGVHLMQPTIEDLLRWGANNGRYTLGGEWWRLITCMFIHIGIIHLALNLYALYTVGIYLEPMLGKTRYVAAYLCTGVYASLTSLFWHGESVVSAGASGAVFGLYGVFLALLSTNLIPKKVRSGLLQSIGVFVLYNLVYGLKAGIDNAAHVGGLVSGLAVGYIYFLSLKKPSFRPVAAAAFILIATTVLTASYVKMNHSDTAEYHQYIEQFSQLENEALAPFNDNDISQAELEKLLQIHSLPRWNQVKSVLQRASGLELEDEYRRRLQLFNEYTVLRIEEAEFFIENKQDTARIRAIQRSIEEKISALNNGK
jgi:rhomboid protease GluP